MSLNSDLAMFKENLDRVCAFCMAEYDPKISHLRKHHAAIEAAQHHFDASDWRIGPGSAVLQNHGANAIFVLDLRKVLFQSLGMDKWNKDGLVSALVDALRELGVESLQKVTFETMALFPTGMSHAEMVALLPGSFLAAKEGLNAVIGDLDDAFVQLHGRHDGMSLILKVAPMTPQDAESTIMSIGNISLFVKTALLDRRVSEFRDKIVGDSLLIQVDLFRENLKREELRGFVNHAVAGVEAVSDAALKHLKSLQPRRR
jgi:hypothetical protein